MRIVVIIATRMAQVGCVLFLLVIVFATIEHFFYEHNPMLAKFLWTLIPAGIGFVIGYLKRK